MAKKKSRMMLAHLGLSLYEMIHTNSQGGNL